ncbi:MAG: hypothetical protein AAF039_01475 [Bacteroidota bacterium]
MTRKELEKIYQEAITLAGLERKGKTMPYTSSNGHMFSLINKANELGIRLSKKDTTEFDSKYGAQPFLSYGATMREYVLIPKELLLQKEELSNYLKKGFEFVNSKPGK